MSLEGRMQAIWDFAVVGGGASGMAAAIAAAEMGDHVILFEKAPALGRKIAASGNGRCNIMNNGKPTYYGDSHFAGEVFRFFPQSSLSAFWEHEGLLLSETEEGRVYPATFHASTVLDILKTNLRLLDVEIRLQAIVTKIRNENGIFLIVLPQETIMAKRVLIAAGGAAYPKLGGTDSGYRLLKSFGHSVTPQSPALCPLRTDSRSISGLSGIRVRCGISLFSPEGMKLHRTHGELLFTEYGISGICAMQCARFIRTEACYAELDFAEPVFPDNQAIFLKLTDRRSRFSAFPPEYLLEGIFLPKLAYAVLKQAGIAVRGRTAGDISDDEILEIIRRMRGYRLNILGDMGLEEAQVTAGGAACREFDPSTMESRIIRNLHASGEVLDVDGDCGGYNLMFAFATGILAGRNGRSGKELNNEKR